MRGHVVRPFVLMLKERVSVGHESGEESLKICSDGGISVFTQDYGGARVGQEDGAEPVVEPGFSHHILNGVIDPCRSSAGGPDAECFLVCLKVHDVLLASARGDEPKS